MLEVLIGVVRVIRLRPLMHINGRQLSLAVTRYRIPALAVLVIAPRVRISIRVSSQRVPPASARGNCDNIIKIAFVIHPMNLRWYRAIRHLFTNAELTFTVSAPRTNQPIDI
jgi:hypothetical protein